METINQIFIYFFQPNPSRLFQYAIPLWILTAMLIAAAVFIIVRIRASKNDKSFKKTFRSYPTRLITAAVLLALYLLSRGSAVPFFSMRLMLFVVLGITGYLIYRLMKAYTREYPEEKKLRHDREELNKYIPRKKRK
ncbi:MAG TPA: hypothetical protein VI588_01680 [Candidatus Gracilibacteria bacterium]|nr:hypothetical protein [Candidatus Gracilibacteria bacterium]